VNHVHRPWRLFSQIASSSVSLSFTNLSSPTSPTATMSGSKAKAPLSQPSQASRYSNVEQEDLTCDNVSPGVARIEVIAQHLTPANRICIFFGVLLIAWAYGLDSTLRVAYQPIAVNALHAHSLLATVTVVRAVIGAAAQVSIVSLKTD
jgi:hypothetical protein